MNTPLTKKQIDLIIEQSRAQRGIALRRMVIDLFDRG